METGLFATLGLVGFIAVIIAFGSAFVPNGSTEALENYVHSGRLRADVRTYSAMVHYLLESEPELPTDTFDFWPTQKNLATPTNGTKSEPSV